jgi:hypothetical protein
MQKPMIGPITKKTDKSTGTNARLLQIAATGAKTREGTTNGHLGAYSRSVAGHQTSPKNRNENRRNRSANA